MSQLFKPFTQADSSTTRQFGGTGLGLAICRQIVEAMGGTIGVRTQKGLGSTFWFNVPLKESQGTSNEEEATTTPERDEPDLVCENPILVVEDNIVNQKVTRRILESSGISVAIAGDGFEAVEAFRSRDFCLILMDCDMPKMDGYEAARRIRKLEDGDDRIPIIALTAHTLPGHREKCLDAGMDDFLVKPIKPKDMVSTLRQWLGTGTPAELQVPPGS